MFDAKGSIIKCDNFSIINYLQKAVKERNQNGPNEGTEDLLFLDGFGDLFWEELDCNKVPPLFLKLFKEDCDRFLSHSIMLRKILLLFINNILVDEDIDQADVIIYDIVQTDVVKEIGEAEGRKDPGGEPAVPVVEIKFNAPKQFINVNDFIEFGRVLSVDLADVNNSMEKDLVSLEVELENIERGSSNVKKKGFLYLPFDKDSIVMNPWTACKPKMAKLVGCSNISRNGAVPSQIPVAVFVEDINLGKSFPNEKDKTMDADMKGFNSGINEDLVAIEEAHVAVVNDISLEDGEIFEEMPLKVASFSMDRNRTSSILLLPPLARRRSLYKPPFHQPGVAECQTLFLPSWRRQRTFSFFSLLEKAEYLEEKEREVNIYIQLPLIYCLRNDNLLEEGEVVSVLVYPSSGDGKGIMEDDDMAFVAKCFPKDDNDTSFLRFIVKELPKGIWVKGLAGEFYQKVEYEGISNICSNCGKIGHDLKTCNEVKEKVILDSNTALPTGVVGNQVTKVMAAKSVAEEGKAAGNSWTLLKHGKIRVNKISVNRRFFNKKSSIPKKKIFPPKTGSSNLKVMGELLEEQFENNENILNPDAFVNVNSLASVPATDTPVDKEDKHVNNSGVNQGVEILNKFDVLSELTECNEAKTINEIGMEEGEIVGSVTEPDFSTPNEGSAQQQNVSRVEDLELPVNIPSLGGIPSTEKKSKLVKERRSLGSGNVIPHNRKVGGRRTKKVGGDY
ncbi:hypothetical protein MA16_Dca007748 [Dendrobium catenatum]|uniref:CCHC-type domain-containing protein n=1 Tax=Dendrobium catenatum TaxID=906689 RepID=A0A2I0X5B0_9ASPA|nr:hypothetical protein MA16_Dca007748 [Dendrobium catenatum]